MKRLCVGYNFHFLTLQCWIFVVFLKVLFIQLLEVKMASENFFLAFRIQPTNISMKCGWRILVLWRPKHMAKMPLHPHFKNIPQDLCID